MKILSVAEILAAPDLKTVEVEVPEWGGTVLLRGMSGFQRDQWEAQFANIDRTKPEDIKKATENFRARIVAAHLVGEDGKPLFTPKQVADLGEKSGAVLDRLYEKCQELSGLSDKDVQELEENLKPAQNGNSGSD